MCVYPKYLGFQNTGTGVICAVCGLRGGENERTLVLAWSLLRDDEAVLAAAILVTALMFVTTA